MKCTLTPNVWSALHSLVAAYRSNERCRDQIKVLISRVCGYSNCYCDTCTKISDEFYDIYHYEKK